jgi:DNA-directed RNA polymerase specialized sigma24 family protein
MIRNLGRLYPRLDAATVRGVGEDAMLEAFLSHDVRQATERTWVKKLVLWRLAEAAGRQPGPAVSFGTDPPILNGVDPEAAFLRATAVRALSHLSIRQQQIVDGRMRGETFLEIGQQLGISDTLAHREAKAAFRILRDLLQPRIVG